MFLIVLEHFRVRHARHRIAEKRLVCAIWTCALKGALIRALQAEALSSLERQRLGPLGVGVREDEVPGGAEQGRVSAGANPQSRTYFFRY